MASRQDWLEAGLRILGEHGAPALTIDLLAGRLGLTKGSFYHHFAGMPGYRNDLLAHFEARLTERFITQVEADGTATPEQKLNRLQEAVLAERGSAGLVIGMRAWAQQDPAAAQVQERVDRTRVAYLRGLMTELGRDPDLGDLCYLALVGGSHVLPALTAEQLRRMWRLITQ